MLLALWWLLQLLAALLHVLLLAKERLLLLANIWLALHKVRLLQATLRLHHLLVTQSLLGTLQLLMLWLW